MRSKNLVRHDDEAYYKHVRSDVISFCADKITKPDSIVDLGCGSGATLNKLGSRYGLGKSSLYGFDLISHENSNLEITSHDLSDGLPDVIDSIQGSRLFLLLDVLEHLTDPAQILSELSALFKPEDRLVISVPNVRCIQVTGPLLLKDRFHYVADGILDSTHYRFFTKTSMEDLIIESGLGLIASEYKAPSVFGKLKFIDMCSFGLLRGITAKQTFFLCGFSGR